MAVLAKSVDLSNHRYSTYTRDHLDFEPIVNHRSILGPLHLNNKDLSMKNAT